VVRILSRSRTRRVVWPSALVWAREYLPHYFTEASAAFHGELLWDLEDDANRLIARVAPRGHGKSVLACLAYPLWCICEYRPAGTHGRYTGRRNIVNVTHEAGLGSRRRAPIRTDRTACAVWRALCERLSWAPADDA